MTQLIGPVIIDLVGTELSQEEQELLQHPSVGGVILFSRNYSTRLELVSLCRAIRCSRKTPLLIAVDQEGGRVQRFGDPFTSLPCMSLLGKILDHFPATALKTAEAYGWIMASELLSVGIDISFVPVLDLKKTENPAIGERAFHRNPSSTIALAASVIRGMHAAGMATTGKHFPGHGSVVIDSHLALPVDDRALDTIVENDMQPFIQLIPKGLDAIMAAHIVFPKVDDFPVGFSAWWLRELLRNHYSFSGMIFSDDLNMKGAKTILQDDCDRAEMALKAGCDMILICNNRSAVITVLDRLPQCYFVDLNRFQRMQGAFQMDFDQLIASKKWKDNQAFLLKQTSGSLEYI